MRSDGNGFHDLTPNTIVNFEPKWSRDGKRIVFVRSFADGFSEDGNGEIATMAPDGSGLRLLTHTPGYETDPAWSPDRRQIVFSRIRANDTEDLYVMTADGQHVRQLTEDGKPNRVRGVVARRQVDRLGEQARRAAGGDLRHAVDGPRRVRAAHAQRQLRRRARVVAGREADRVPEHALRQRRDLGDGQRRQPSQAAHEQPALRRPAELVGRRQADHVEQRAATGRPGSG